MQSLSLTFDLPLRPARIPAFRGAIAHLAGLRHDLFHNHDNDFSSRQTHINRYPLIQYRVANGRAAIVGWNEGAEALDDLYLSGRFAAFEIDRRTRPLQVAARVRDLGVAPLVLPVEALRAYHVAHYLPFGKKTFQEYKAARGLRERVALLERLLRNHIVAFAYGIGWELPESPRLQVTVTAIHAVNRTTTPNAAVMGFGLDFQVNAVLPDGLGIGRKAAFGFGLVEGAVCVGKNGNSREEKANVRFGAQRILPSVLENR